MGEDTRGVQAIAAEHRVNRSERLRPCRRAVNRAAMRANGNCVWQLALRRKVAGDVRIVRSVIADVGEPLMGVKMLRLRPFWIGASPRVGRASRSDVNLLTGSVGIVPNIRLWRNGCGGKIG